MISMNKHRHKSTCAYAICLAAFIAVSGLASAAPPATVTIQAKLEAAGGAPVTGSRAYVIQLFDAPTGGGQLGADISGNAAFSATGRAAITFAWPAAAEASDEVWYRLGVDSDAVPDGVQADEFFPDRIEVTSVPFARRAADSDAVGGTPAADLSTDAERDAAIAAAVAAAVAGLVPSPAVPAAPTRLRIGPSLRGAPFRKLAWNIAGFAGMANFIVYESSAPITEGNKASALKRFVTTTEFELPIFPDTGMRFFRVAATNFAGDESLLSIEFGLDTTARIAYIADQDLNDVFEVYSAPAGGGGPVVKVNGPFLTTSNVSTFVFSPDGTRIAYRADEDVDGVFELYVAPAAGGGPSVKVNSTLPAGGGIRNGFAFSPDSTQIAYVANQDDPAVSELYIAPAAGGGGSVKLSAPLVAGGEVFPIFEFSPDGTRLAYIADQDSDDVVELYTVPTAGGPAVKINPPLVTGGNVSPTFKFSPDSARIVYLAVQEIVPVFELYVAPALGGPVVKINPPLVSGGSVKSQAFAFLPDGSRIAYRADQDTDAITELYVASAAGGGAAVKINPPIGAGRSVDIGAFAFSPDGSATIYRSDEQVDNVSEIYIASTGGGGRTRINTTLISGGDVISYAISPDGSRVVYRADQSVDNRFEIFTAPILGGSSVGSVIRLNSLLTFNGDVSAGGFAFSPDGARVVYRADKDSDNVIELYVVPVAGGPSVKINPSLPAGGDVGLFAFSPLGLTP